MAAVLTQVILLGLAAALSPTPAIVSLVLQSTPRHVANSAAYIGGGLLVYFVIVLVGLVATAGAVGTGHEGQPSTASSALIVLLGALFLLFAFAAMRSTRKEEILPQVNRRLRAIGPWKSFGLGLALLSPHAKNLVLIAAAFQVVDTSGLSLPSALLALALFVAIALAPSAIPPVLSLVLPRERADAVMRTCSSWIDRHAMTIVVSVTGFMGIKLLAQGLAALLS